MPTGQNPPRPPPSGATPAPHCELGAQLPAKKCQGVGARCCDAQPAWGASPDPAQGPDTVTVPPTEGAAEAQVPNAPSEQKLRAHYSHTKGLFGPDDHRTQAAWKELQACRDRKRAERPTHQKLNIAHQELLAAKRRAIEAHNQVEAKQLHLQQLLQQAEAATQEVHAAKQHACEADAAVAQAEGQIETLNGLLTQEAQQPQAPEQALHKLATALLAAVGAPELTARISPEAMQQLLPVLTAAAAPPSAPNAPQGEQLPPAPEGDCTARAAETPRGKGVAPKQEAEGGGCIGRPDAAPTQLDPGDVPDDEPMPEQPASRQDSPQIDPSQGALGAPAKHVSSPAACPEVKRAKHRTKSPAGIARP